LKQICIYILKGIFMKKILVFLFLTFFLYGEDYVKQADDEALKGNRKEAIELYSKAIDLLPTNAYLYSIRGALYIELKDFTSANKDLDTAISLDANCSKCYYGKGVVGLGLMDYQSAVKYFSQAISLEKHPWFYLGRGIAYIKLNNNKAAVDDFSQTISINDQITLAYLMRGISYNSLSAYDSAIDDFSEVLDRDSQKYVLMYQEKGLPSPESSLSWERAHALAYQGRGLAYMLTYKPYQASREAKKACDLGQCYILNVFKKLRQFKE
jgi:tetratricopeptide (TPR) repeat protein